MNFAIRPTTVSLPNKANAFGKSGPCICPVVAIRQGMNNILPFAPAAFPAPPGTHSSSSPRPLAPQPPCGPCLPAPQSASARTPQRKDHVKLSSDQATTFPQQDHTTAPSWGQVCSQRVHSHMVCPQGLVF